MAPPDGPGDPVEDRGPFVSTLSGGRWYPHDPRPEDVNPYDLRAIAKVCRWSGSCKMWLSVAEHSILVAAVVKGWGGSALDEYDALFHDAHEAYPPGDVAAPFKTGDSPLAVALRAQEQRAREAVRTAVGASLVMPTIVKEADAFLLSIEADTVLEEPIGWLRNFPPPPPHRAMIPIPHVRGLPWSVAESEWITAIKMVYNAKFMMPMRPTLVNQPKPEPKPEPKP